MDIVWENEDIFIDVRMASLASIKKGIYKLTCFVGTIPACSTPMGYCQSIPAPNHT